MDIQDFYIAQIVAQGEMDQIYADAEAAEQNMAKEANLGQVPVAVPAGDAGALRSGGILSGLVVTADTPVVAGKTVVNVSAGVARDSDGERIVLPADATVSLLNLGSTPQGDITNALGDGGLTASSITAGEAWVSLYLAKDTALSDIRVDGLGNSINYRQVESFHFELFVGADASAPAIARTNLDDSRVLLCDILLDNAGEIRVITSVDTAAVATYVIATSTYSLALIGYGPDDAADLTGRRSDWAAIDYTNEDGTLALELTSWRDAANTDGPSGKDYFNIRTGDPRSLARELAVRFAKSGTPTAVAGSELIGGKSTTGSARTSPAGAVLELGASQSVHAQLVALKNKVNTLLSRGTDTFTGNLTIVGTLLGITTEDTLRMTHSGSPRDGKHALMIQAEQATKGDWLGIRKYGLLEVGSHFLEQVDYVDTTPDATIANHLPQYKWSARVTGAGAGNYAIVSQGSGITDKPAITVSLNNGIAAPCSFGMLGPQMFRLGDSPNTSMLMRISRASSPGADHEARYGLWGVGGGHLVGVVHTTTGVFGRIVGSSSSDTGVVNLDGGVGSFNDIMVIVLSSSSIFVQGPGGSETITLSSGTLAVEYYAPIVDVVYSTGGSSFLTYAILSRLFIHDRSLISGY